MKKKSDILFSYGSINSRVKNILLNEKAGKGDIMGEILRAEGISKTYHTGTVDVHALKKCDISIRKGEFTAIIGKSGSGKSTLLRILGSMDKPDEGEVYFDDINIGIIKSIR